MIEYMRPARRMWRCEFCRKSFHQKTVCQDHENSCTSNPDRSCGWCAELYGGHVKLEPRLTKDEVTEYDYFRDGMTTSPPCLERVISHYDGCPGCIMAELKQAGTSPTSCGLDYDALVKEWREYESNNRDPSW